MTSPQKGLELMKLLKDNIEALKKSVEGDNRCSLIQTLKQCDFEDWQLTTGCLYQCERFNNFSKMKSIESSTGYMNERIKIAEANKNWLCQELGLDATTVIQFPMLLGHPYHPNAINMLPLDGAAVVPRQHTLRIPVEFAKSLLEGNKVVSPWIDFEDDFLESSAKIEFILDEEMKIKDIASLFVPKALVADLVQEIKTYNKLNSDAKTVPGLSKICIPCPGTVDLFDAYIYQVLRGAGVKVAFMETNYLQLHGGNLHCATNLRPKKEPHASWIEELKTSFFSDTKKEISGSNEISASKARYETFYNSTL